MLLKLVCALLVCSALAETLAKNGSGKAKKRNIVTLLHNRLQTDKDGEALDASLAATVWSTTPDWAPRTSGRPIDRKLIGTGLYREHSHYHAHAHAHGTLVSRCQPLSLSRVFLVFDQPVDVTGLVPSSVHLSLSAHADFAAGDHAQVLLCTRTVCYIILTNDGEETHTPHQTWQHFVIRINEQIIARVLNEDGLLWVAFTIGPTLPRDVGETTGTGWSLSDVRVTGRYESADPDAPPAQRRALDGSHGQTRGLPLSEIAPLNTTGLEIVTLGDTKHTIHV
eukprot:m.53542 g.53542  ORF g.53542 m.53542 type:complete len:281 (-) comp11832_c0_seq6:121-963(-)